MTRVLFASLTGLLALLAGCGGGGSSSGSQPPIPERPAEPPAQFVFQPQGLAGLTVERLYLQQDKLLALSSDGLYQLQGESWTLLGFRGQQASDLAFISDQHWLLALTLASDSGEQTHQLHETRDAGRSWQQLRHPFGADERSEGEAIFALRYEPGSAQLIATGIHALARSTDQGRSWQLLSGGWSGFGRSKSALGIDPANGDIWWGGQGALEDGILSVYRPADQSTRDFRRLLPEPSVYYNIRFRSAEGSGASSEVYASGEGGILHSADQGQSWRNLLGDVNYRFYFDLAIDPERRNRLYTAGWDKSYDLPQPLILQWSDDNGGNWQRLTYPAPASFFGGVRSLLLVKQGQQRYLYLGLYKGGVMRVAVNR